MTRPLVTRAAYMEERHMWSEHDPTTLKHVASSQGSTILGRLTVHDRCMTRGYHTVVHAWHAWCHLQVHVEVQVQCTVLPPARAFSEICCPAWQNSS